MSRREGRPPRPVSLILNTFVPPTQFNLSSRLFSSLLLFVRTAAGSNLACPYGRREVFICRLQNNVTLLTQLLLHQLISVCPSLSVCRSLLPAETPSRAPHHHHHYHHHHHRPRRQTPINCSFEHVGHLVLCFFIVLLYHNIAFSYISLLRPL